MFVLAMLAFVILVFPLSLERRMKYFSALRTDSGEKLWTVGQVAVQLAGWLIGDLVHH